MGTWSLPKFVDAPRRAVANLSPWQRVRLVHGQGWKGLSPLFWGLPLNGVSRDCYYKGATIKAYKPRSFGF